MAQNIARFYFFPVFINSIFYIKSIHGRVTYVSSFRALNEPFPAIGHKINVGYKIYCVQCSSK